MNTVSIDSLNATQLARLLKLDDEPLWNKRDASAALLHQLSAPLLPDLASVSEFEPLIEGFKELMAQRHLPANHSFLDELTSSSPSLELLDAIKRFAKETPDKPTNPMRGTPALALYFGAVAATLVRCRVRVARLSNLELRNGFQWAAAQAAAEGLSGVFRQALFHLDQLDASFPGRAQ